MKVVDAYILNKYLMNIAKITPIKPLRLIAARDRTLDYKGWKLIAEEERDDDCIKWLHEIISPEGKRFYPSLDAFDPDIDGMKGFVDRKEHEAELTKLLGPILASQKGNMKITKINKKAQFENEGVNSIEDPARTQYNAEQEMETNKRRPPHHTTEIASAIKPYIGKMINAMFTAYGTTCFVEFTDGKLYEIDISPIDSGRYKQYIKIGQEPLKPSDPSDKLS